MTMIIRAGVSDRQLATWPVFILSENRRAITRPFEIAIAVIKRTG